MATKQETARYGWVRSAALGALLVVLAVVTASNGTEGVVPLLLGAGGVGLVVYSLIRRDRDRREARA